MLFRSRLRFLRDTTRGGLAAILNEICSENSFGLNIRESAIPINDDVRAVSDILGLNPIEIANEGVLTLVTSRDSAQEALDILRRHEIGKEAAVIGNVTEAYPGRVILETLVGGKRILDYPRGLLLPRIC